MISIWRKIFSVLLFFVFSVNVLAGTHPADINPNDDHISVNEMTFYGSCWKSAPTIPAGCPAGASLQNAVRAGTIWNSTLDGIYYFDATKTCPLCWQAGAPPPPTGTWAKRFGDSLKDATIASAVDASGNIVVTGYFSGTVNFGGSDLTSAGGFDIFLAKYNSAGVHQWSYRFGGTGDETVAGIAVDPLSGNIALAGAYYGSTNLGGTNFVSNGNQDAFVAEYTTSGQPIWSHSYGGTSGDGFASVAVDSQGNVAVTGWFQAYYPGISFGGSNLYASPGIILAKYSPTGGHLWSETFTYGSSVNSATQLVIDKNDNILLTGSFSNWIDFGGGALNSATQTYEDLFVAKFTTAGTYVWAQRFGGPNMDRGTALTLDSNNDVIVGGRFYGQTDLGGGLITGTASYNDNFIAKYSGVNGSYRWSVPFRGNAVGMVNSLKCDALNNVFVVGTFQGTVNFGAQTLSSNVNSYDVFAAEYNTSGGAVWLTKLGGSTQEEGYSVAIDAAGKPVIGGYFTGTVDFGGTSLTSAGSYDAFLMRMNP